MIFTCTGCRKRHNSVVAIVVFLLHKSSFHKTSLFCVWTIFRSVYKVRHAVIRVCS